MWRHCKKIGSRRKLVWIRFAFWSDSFWTLSRAATWRTASPWLSISASHWSGPGNFEAYQISPRYAVTIAWAFAIRKKFNFTVGDLETWTVLVSHVAACDIHAKSATSVSTKAMASFLRKLCSVCCEADREYTKHAGWSIYKFGGSKTATCVRRLRWLRSAQRFSFWEWTISKKKVGTVFWNHASLMDCGMCLATNRQSNQT